MQNVGFPVWMTWTVAILDNENKIWLFFYGIFKIIILKLAVVAGAPA